MSSKLSYSEKLKDPRWQKLRLKVFERDKFICQCCGNDEATLAVHHKKYSGKNPWDTSFDNLITYCEGCHSAIECVIKITGNNSLRAFNIRAVKDGFGSYVFAFIDPGKEKSRLIVIDENKNISFSMSHQSNELYSLIFDSFSRFINW